MPSARGVTWARFRVTVVAITAIAILSVLVFLLTGGTLLTQKITLYLYIPDATGLERGSAVRVNGTSVGKVDRIELSGSSVPDRVIRLTMSLEQDKLSNIPIDSTAQITTEGSVGNQFVAITQGTAGARIQPNDEIVYRAAPELLKTLDVVQFARELRSADQTLTEIEQGQNLVGQLVVGTDMYTGLLGALNKIDRDFRAATNSTSTGQAGRLLRSDETYRQLSVPLVQLDDQLARIQAGQGDLGRLLREDGQYVQLRNQAATLRRSIADLRSQPFMTTDDLYNSWNLNLVSLVRQVDQFDATPALRNSMTFDNLNGSLHQLQTFVHDFRTDPKKFLRLQLF